MPEVNPAEMSSEPQPKPKHKHPSKLDVYNKTKIERIIDRTTDFFGSPKFIYIYAISSIIYCVGNVVLWQFDPYPFQFYTFAVSVLAILLTSIVLIATNRKEKLSAARAENAYHQIDEANTKLSETLTQLGKHEEILLDQNRVLAAQTDLAKSEPNLILAALTRIEERQNAIEARQIELQTQLIVGEAGGKQSIWQRLRGK